MYLLEVEPMARNYIIPVERVYECLDKLFLDRLFE